MAHWLISIAGIALLTMLCDVILPEGSTKKYIRTVIGVVVSLVIALPIVNFLASVNVDQTFEEQIVIQQDYVDMQKYQEQKMVCNQIDDLCAYFGVEDCKVEVNSDKKYVVSVYCNGEQYLQLKNSLEHFGDQIVLVWSESHVET